MRLIVQKLEIYWSRRGEDSVDVEHGFELTDEALASTSDWRHVLVINETDDFRSDAVVDEPMTRRLQRDAGLFLDYDPDHIDVHFEWSNAVGVPERRPARAFTVKHDTWGRLEFRGRLPTEDDWLSQHIVYNIGLFEKPPQPGIFTGEPHFKWTSLADLSDHADESDD